MPKLNSITSIGDQMGNWIKACTIDILGEGQMFSLDHNDKKILLSNTNGKILATDRICTHAEADLSTGILSENGLMCPLHLSVFDLNTGKPNNPPAENSLQTYKIKLEDNNILVEV